MAKWEPVLVDGQPFLAGVVLVDKPPGISSFGVIRKVRRLLGVKKVVAGEVGTRLRILFEHYGIEVETGVSGALQEVIRRTISSSASQS